MDPRALESTPQLEAQRADALWQVESWIERGELPTAGEMSQSMADEDFDGAAYDRDNPERLRKTLY